MPAAIAARNGGASSSSHCSRVWWIVGRSSWLSVIVSPWPGKCLAVGRHARRLVAPHLRRDQPGDRVRVGAEGAHADDRVGRVDVRVGHGGVVLTDAQGAQLTARDPAQVARVGPGAARADAHRARQQRRGLTHPGHDAVLLVGRDQHGQTARQTEGRLLDAVGQVGDLVRVAGVVRPGEVDDAADPVLGDQLGGRAHPDLGQVGVDVGLVGVGGGVAVDPHHEELADLLLQRHPGDEGAQFAVVGAVRAGGRVDRAAGRQDGGDARRGGEDGTSGRTGGACRGSGAAVGHVRSFGR
ncbi:hypothetical protein SALBM217S_00259 [Streptomyces griseoloalbus]